MKPQVLSPFGKMSSFIELLRRADLDEDDTYAQVFAKLLKLPQARDALLEAIYEGIPKAEAQPNPKTQAMMERLVQCMIALNQTKESGALLRTQLSKLNQENRETMKQCTDFETQLIEAKTKLAMDFEAKEELKQSNRRLRRLSMGMGPSTALMPPATPVPTPLSQVSLSTQNERARLEAVTRRVHLLRHEMDKLKECQESLVVRMTYKAGTWQTRFAEKDQLCKKMNQQLIQEKADFEKELKDLSALSGGKLLKEQQHMKYWKKMIENMHDSVLGFIAADKRFRQKQLEAMNSAKTGIALSMDAACQYGKQIEAFKRENQVQATRIGKLNEELKMASHLISKVLSSNRSMLFASSKYISRLKGQKLELEKKMLIVESGKTEELSRMITAKDEELNKHSELLQKQSKALKALETHAKAKETKLQLYIRSQHEVISLIKLQIFKLKSKMEIQRKQRGVALNEQVVKMEAALGKYKKSQKGLYATMAMNSQVQSDSSREVTELRNKLAEQRKDMEGKFAALEVLKAELESKNQELQDLSRSQAANILKKSDLIGLYREGVKRNDVNANQAILLLKETLVNLQEEKSRKQIISEARTVREHKLKNELHLMTKTLASNHIVVSAMRDRMKVMQQERIKSEKKISAAQVANFESALIDELTKVIESNKLVILSQSDEVKTQQQVLEALAMATKKNELKQREFIKKQQDTIRRNHADISDLKGQVIEDRKGRETFNLVQIAKIYTFVDKLKQSHAGVLTKIETIGTSKSESSHEIVKLRRKLAQQKIDLEEALSDLGMIKEKAETLTSQNRVLVHEQAEAAERLRSCYERIQQDSLKEKSSFVAIQQIMDKYAESHKVLKKTKAKLTATEKDKVQIRQVIGSLVRHSIALIRCTDDLRGFCETSIETSTANSKAEIAALKKKQSETLIQYHSALNACKAQMVEQSCRKQKLARTFATAVPLMSKVLSSSSGSIAILKSRIDAVEAEKTGLEQRSSVIEAADGKKLSLANQKVSDLRARIRSQDKDLLTLNSKLSDLKNRIEKDRLSRNALLLGYTSRIEKTMSKQKESQEHLKQRLSVNAIGRSEASTEVLDLRTQLITQKNQFDQIYAAKIRDEEVLADLREHARRQAEIIRNTSELLGSCKTAIIQQSSKEKRAFVMISSLQQIMTKLKSDRDASRKSRKDKLALSQAEKARMKELVGRLLVQAQTLMASSMNLEHIRSQQVEKAESMISGLKTQINAERTNRASSISLLLTRMGPVLARCKESQKSLRHKINMTMMLEHSSSKEAQMAQKIIEEQGEKLKTKIKQLSLFNEEADARNEELYNENRSQADVIRRASALLGSCKEGLLRGHAKERSALGLLGALQQATERLRVNQDILKTKFEERSASVLQFREQQADIESKLAHLTAVKICLEEKARLLSNSTKQAQALRQGASLLDSCKETIRAETATKTIIMTRLEFLKLEMDRLRLSHEALEMSRGKKSEVTEAEKAQLKQVIGSLISHARILLASSRTLKERQGSSLVIIRNLANEMSETKNQHSAILTRVITALQTFMEQVMDRSAKHQQLREQLQTIIPFVNSILRSNSGIVSALQNEIRDLKTKNSDLEESLFVVENEKKKVELEMADISEAYKQRLDRNEVLRDQLSKGSDLLRSSSTCLALCKERIAKTRSEGRQHLSSLALTASKLVEMNRRLAERLRFIEYNASYAQIRNSTISESLRQAFISMTASHKKLIQKLRSLSMNETQAMEEIAALKKELQNQKDITVLHIEQIKYLEARIQATVTENQAEKDEWKFAKAKLESDKVLMANGMIAQLQAQKRMLVQSEMAIRSLSSRCASLQAFKSSITESLTKAIPAMESVVESNHQFHEMTMELSTHCKLEREDLISEISGLRDEMREAKEECESTISKYKAKKRLGNQLLLRAGCMMNGLIKAYGNKAARLDELRSLVPQLQSFVTSIHAQQAKQHQLALPKTTAIVEDHMKSMDVIARENLLVDLANELAQTQDELEQALSLLRVKLQEDRQVIRVSQPVALSELSGLIDFNVLEQTNVH